MSEGVETVTLERLYGVYLALPEFEDALSLDAIRERVGEQFLAQVYQVNGEGVGFKLGYARDPGEFYSWLGGVLPGQRGRGVAQALLEAQERWVRDQGFEILRVRSRNRFPAMLRLLIRNGYLLEQVLPDQDPFWNKIQFRKDLKAAGE